MKHLLRLLLAALALNLSNCSKDADKAQPAPNAPSSDLIGCWQGLTNRTVQTTSAGQVVDDYMTTFAAGTYSLDIRATEILVYVGTTVDKRFTYTRVGNTLQSVGNADGPSTIQDLTPTRLVLVSSSTQGNNNTVTQTLTYSR